MTEGFETKEQKRGLGIISIMDAVSEVFDVTRDEIMCTNRSKRMTRPRFVVYYLAWLHTKRSVANIGRFMDRDHTTVMYGRDKCISLKNSEPEFAEKVEACQELAFEIEHRKEMAAMKEMAEVQKALRKEQELEQERKRKLEELSKELSRTGILRGDKVVFPRVDSERQHRVVEFSKGSRSESTQGDIG